MCLAELIEVSSFVSVKSQKGLPKVEFLMCSGSKRSLQHTIDKRCDNFCNGQKARVGG